MTNQEKRDQQILEEEQKSQQLKEVMLRVREYEKSELIDLITDLCCSSQIITNIIYGMVYNEPDH